MKHSPLHEKHLSLNAKMADFGGWLMPIEYPGAGTLAEHAAVREKVGIFDVSHLGKASVKGSQMIWLVFKMVLRSTHCYVMNLAE
jgi:aminomethyltransferase